MGKIDTSVFELGRGNLVKVPEVFKSVFPGKKALIVADANTWKAAGEAVKIQVRLNTIPLLLDKHNAPM